jgi:hypothetical protein
LNHTKADSGIPPRVIHNEIRYKLVDSEPDAPIRRLESTSHFPTFDGSLVGDRHGSPTQGKIINRPGTDRFANSQLACVCLSLRLTAYNSWQEHDEAQLRYSRGGRFSSPPRARAPLGRPPRTCATVTAARPTSYLFDQIYPMLVELGASLRQPWMIASQPVALLA